MPELVRSVIAELSRLVGRNNVPTKRATHLPLSISLTNRQFNLPDRNNSMFGFTCDLSKTEISFVVPSAYLGDRHLFCNDEINFEIRVKLLDGSVKMEVVIVRYDVNYDGHGFLVGARIVRMSEEDRACYNSFLRTSTRKLGSSPVLTHSQNV
jgi:hypothetical protein